MPAREYELCGYIFGFCISFTDGFVVCLEKEGVYASNHQTRWERIYYGGSSPKGRG